MKKTFKVIVAGGRDFVPNQRSWEILDNLVSRKMAEGFVIEVVCGEARGGDAFGKLWANTRGHQVISMRADWDRYGKRAGYLRNEEMGNYADALVAFWEGSPGTRHMIGYMVKLKKPFVSSIMLEKFNYERDTWKFI